MTSVTKLETVDLECPQVRWEGLSSGNVIFFLFWGRLLGESVRYNTMLQSKTDIDQVICLLSPLHIQVCLQNLSQIQAGNTVLHLPQVLVLDGGRGGGNFP